MNLGLPANLINPSFAELNEAAETEGVTFSEDTPFLFKCWQTYHIQSNFGNDHSVPRSRNLFWRIWSNPNLRAVSNEEFNELWQRCRHQTALRPYRPDPGLWERWVGRRPQKIQETTTLTTPTKKSERTPRSPRPGKSAISQQTLDVPGRSRERPPESPRASKITFDELSLEPSDRQGGREQGTSGSGVAPTRPGYRRTTSGRTVATVAGKGARSRPGLHRRRSSQNRNVGRQTDTTVEISGPAAEQDGPGDVASNARTRQAAFQLGTSWQDDDTSEDEKPTPTSIGPSRSLVDDDFRSKFVRQMSTGTSFTGPTSMRKNRSSVRFVDLDEDANGTAKGKGRADEFQPEPMRERGNSQVVEDEGDDESDGLGPGIQRVQSQLSMMIKDRRAQSGSQDLGPSQPESDKNTEAHKKREELLRIGREAAKPIIPRSRRGSPRDHSRFETPSPNATF